MMDESRLFVFKMWRVLITILTACMLPGYVDADDVNTWGWVSLGVFLAITGLLWLRRLPPAGMYALMLLANAANAVGNAQERNIASGVLSGVVALACAWWAWEARNDPSERVVAERVAERGAH